MDLTQVFQEKFLQDNFNYYEELEGFKEMIIEMLNSKNEFSLNYDQQDIDNFKTLIEVLRKNIKPLSVKALKNAFELFKYLTKSQ